MSSIVSAMIDSREPEWVQKLTFDGAAVVTILLDAGDVWLTTADNTVIIVERKTPTDLLNTLRAERLFAQCAAMREYSDWCYLVISGELQRGASGKTWAEQRQTGWSWDSVQGALLTVQELANGEVGFCHRESWLLPVPSALALIRSSAPSRSRSTACTSWMSYGTPATVTTDAHPVIVTPVFATILSASLCPKARSG